jgi:hypothetical protein
VHETDNGADPTAYIHQVLDGLDQIVRRADGGGGAFPAGGLLDRVLGRGERLHTRPLQGANSIFVMPSH